MQKISASIILELKNIENTKNIRNNRKIYATFATIEKFLGEIGNICNIVLDIDLMHQREIFFIVDLCTFLGVRFNPNNTHSHKLTKNFI